ncbi:MAG: hypothetical protein ACR5K2_00455 [Wolbachia sp.]
MGLLVSLFYVYQYILRVIPSVVVPELMVRFNIGTTKIGQFCGLYYAGHVLAHIPAGIFLDRLGSKICHTCLYYVDIFERFAFSWF